MTIDQTKKVATVVSLKATAFNQQDEVVAGWTGKLTGAQIEHRETMRRDCLLRLEQWADAHKVRLGRVVLQWAWRTDDGDVLDTAEHEERYSRADG